jgi:hypothetical protein
LSRIPFSTWKTKDFSNAKNLTPQWDHMGIDVIRANEFDYQQLKINISHLRRSINPTKVSKEKGSLSTSDNKE